MSEPEETTLEYNWGGDGSDLDQPVRAYVEAALVPSSGAYPPPLDQLLHLGNALVQHELEERIDALGLTQAHVPDLIRMTRDRALNLALEDSDESWAPIHAITTLAKLDVSAYVADLMPLFDLDNDWFGEDLPEILGGVGEPALEPLRQYAQDRTRWQSGRNYSFGAISAIGKQHPELRDQAVRILSEILEQGVDEDRSVNGFLLAELLNLEAVEALPVIRTAFEQNSIDTSIAGNWPEVLEALDQEIDQSDPLVQRSRSAQTTRQAGRRAQLPNFGGGPARPSSRSSKPSASSKQKNKRKQSAAARKTNKKKKRK